VSPYPRWVQRYQESNLREVGPGLYVGNIAAPTVRSWYAVVDLDGGNPPKVYADVPVLLRWPFDDGTPIPVGLLTAATAVVCGAREAQHSTLIHCAAGLSRSPSVAYAILRRLDGLSHAQALARVQHSRWTGTYPLERTLDSARAWVHEPPPKRRR
jgi:protein-tyrosine phosphatase